jgi:polar amino acid transport system substrate-binding protein
MIFQKNLLFAAAIFSTALLLSVFIFGQNQVVAAEKVVISTIEGGGILPKIAKEIMARAYARTGKQVEYLNLPGKRAVMTANKGGSDAELVRSIRASKIYKNLIRVPGVVVTDEMVAYAVSVEKKISSPEDLAPFITGFRRGSTIPTKMTKGMNFVEFESLEQGIKMLERKRIDIMLYFRIPADLTINSKFSGSNIRQISDKLRVVKLYHYVHKRNKDFVPGLENALKEMDANGEKKAIIDRIIAGSSRGS